MDASNNPNRRQFIRNVLTGSGAALLAPVLPSLASARSRSLTILHTNDVHSHIEPFESNHPKYAGRGGVARRAALIRDIRRTTSNVLLFDSGDIFQGTPYFNYFAGEPEIRLMSLMGYDAATLGNHDFDNGIDSLANQLQFATFPMLNANYDFTGTSMDRKTLPYRIFQKSGIRIGVFGLGIQLEGLVDAKLTGKTTYQDPIEQGRKWAGYLKDKKHCHLVICLSHLGYRYPGAKVSDVLLAENCEDLDLILGGHTHTFMDEPFKVVHASGKEVLVAQAGWAGLRLGRLDYHFDAASGTPKSVSVSMKDF